jgi:hypothetical protein
MDHGRAQNRGGRDHPNNLRPAHGSCNASKRDGTNGAARAKHGFDRAPFTLAEATRRRQRQLVIGMAAGAVLGLVTGSAPVFAVASLVGALVGFRLPVSAPR